MKLINTFERFMIFFFNEVPYTDRPSTQRSHPQAHPEKTFGFHYHLHYSRLIIFPLDCGHVKERQQYFCTRNGGLPRRKMKLTTLFNGN